LKSKWGTQCLSNSHNDILNGVTSQTQKQLHSGVSIANILAFD